MPGTDERIARWLETNTFHHSEFWDMQELVRAKREAGLTISLCIPTLNEETTIGKEIIVFKSELMDRYPLIDEIAVIDSGSTDRTLEIAASYGADTYLSADILPGHGFKGRERGESLESDLPAAGGISSAMLTRTSKTSTRNSRVPSSRRSSTGPRSSM